MITTKDIGKKVFIKVYYPHLNAYKWEPGCKINAVLGDAVWILDQAGVAIKVTSDLVRVLEPRPI